MEAAADATGQARREALALLGRIPVIAAADHPHKRPTSALDPAGAAPLRVAADERSDSRRVVLESVRHLTAAGAVEAVAVCVLEPPQRVEQFLRFVRSFCCCCWTWTWKSDRTSAVSSAVRGAVRDDSIL